MLDLVTSGWGGVTPLGRHQTNNQLPHQLKPALPTPNQALYGNREAKEKEMAAAGIAKRKKETPREANMHAHTHEVT